MKMKPTITFADNGNLDSRSDAERDCKTVIAPQTPDVEITGAQEPVQLTILQALRTGFFCGYVL